MDTLIQQLIRYTSREQMFPKGCSVLLAVSGGIDSMAMMHLLHRAGLKTSVAHCNFGLRGTESDEDERFVVRQAAALDINAFVKRFDTAKYASDKGISIQMAARELRYGWFEELARDKGFARIAVAHHRDDSAETFIINMARGTGIRGLGGIRPVVGMIVRPLLFASRQEIAEFVSSENIAFREDSSNQGDKYARNYIRHHLLPGLEHYFPQLRSTLCRDMANIRGACLLYDETVALWRERACRNEGDTLFVDIGVLQSCPSPATLLFEILCRYGLSHIDAESILEASQGRQFFGTTHRLACDRGRLIITPLGNAPLDGEFPLDMNCGCRYPLCIEATVFDKPADYHPNPSPEVAQLDADRLSQPLSLRHWRTGDRFKPLGLSGVKKLSDFFTDIKLSPVDKENVFVVTSEERIIWVVGYRIDHHFRITKETQKVLQLTLATTAAEALPLP